MLPVNSYAACAASSQRPRSTQVKESLERPAYHVIHCCAFDTRMETAGELVVGHGGVEHLSQVRTSAPLSTTISSPVGNLPYQQSCHCWSVIGND